MSRSLTALLLLGACLLGLTGAVYAMAAEHTIGQKNKEFSQAEITVKPGDAVVFANDDEVTHNVFSNSPCCKFNLKTQAPGDKSSVTFEKEGTVEVRCAIHPKMKLTIHVKP